MTEATRPDLRDLSEMSRLAGTSVELILRLQDGSGAYPASPTFSAYAGYCWFRDGAFIADAMSSAGAAESADRFFDWCSGIITARREQIERIVSSATAGRPRPDSEMLPTRFTFSGEDGSDDWWDFQLDGYGTWLWAVAEHSQRHRVSLDRWLPAIVLTVEYLISSWMRPCFDWWEEHSERVHVSTLSCIAAGLDAVGSSVSAEHGSRIRSTVDAIRSTIETRGIVDGHLAKWIGSSDVDASLLAAVAPLALFPASSPVGSATVDSISETLMLERGVHRYLRDTFFGGGQWPLLSCFLGLAYEARGERAAALAQLAWACQTADESGFLPEQVDWHLLAPNRHDEWVARWGAAAQPLLWSHAMYIRLAVAVGVLEADAS